MVSSPPITDPAYFAFGAAVRGSSHETSGMPCQDAYAVRSHGRGTIAIAVADGLGSAKHSELGARAAVDAAVGTDYSVTVEVMVAAMMTGARGALAELSGELGCDLRDLACTLIVVAARDGEVAVAHIGDGAVVVSDEDAIAILSAPAESEYADEVDPLTAADWYDRVRLTGSRATQIAVLTDGCQRAALRRSPDGWVAHEPFFAPLFHHARMSRNLDAASSDIAALLAGAKMSEHSDDDKTLVIAHLERPEEVP